MEELKYRYRITAIVGAAMIASVFIYLGIAEFIKASAPMPGWSQPKQQWQMIRIILAAAAVSEIFAIIFFKRLLLSTGPGNLSATGPGYSVSELAQKLSIASIIVFAICDSIAIFGLVLFFLSGNERDLIVFAMVSLALFIFHFPRYRQWEYFVNEKLQPPEPDISKPPAIG